MSSLAEMKKRFETDITARDVIVFILSGCGSNQLFNEQEKIHEAFYQVKQMEKIKPYFENYNFTSWGKPYCEELDNSLMAIADSSIIQTLNPAYKEITIKCSDAVIGEIERKAADTGLVEALNEAQKLFINVINGKQ